MLFTIAIVCLNPGSKLKETLKSVLAQHFTDYEILIKDGGSSDESLQQLPSDARIRLVQCKDAGIYDAMNQALQEAKGTYIYFLNCGDYLADEDVLTRLADFIMSQEESYKWDIVYGNIYERKTGSFVHSNPKIDAFACYRNVPCHQACFYKRELILKHPFCTGYRVRADYEQFLWCYFTANAALQYVDFIISSYEGGGFSETKSNRLLSKKEHQAICKTYMSGAQLIGFRLIMLMTLAPIRTWIAENPKTASVYNGIKKRIYGG